MQSLADRGRIRGSEVEYQLVILKDGMPCPALLRNDTELQTFFWMKCVPSHLVSSFFIPRSNWLWLSNGARIGVDCGGQLEYATQETSNSLDLLACEKAGENITEQSIVRANEHWTKKGITGITLRIFKNNLDSSGNSEGACGTHLNYMFRRDEDKLKFMQVAELLWPHLISEKFYCGNGWIEYIDDKISFRISQRAKITTEFLSGSTASRRPIINTRDESHCDVNHYRRIHIIAADSIMTETAIYLRSGVTALILDMIEEGFLTECPFYYKTSNTYADSKKVDAFHVFSKDTSLRTVYTFDGGNFSMVDIQEWYFEKAYEFCEKTDRFTDENKNVLKLWEKIINCARSENPIQKLKPYTDWAAKYCLIEQDMSRFGYGWDTPPDKIIEVFKRDPQSGERRIVPQKVFNHLKALDLNFLEVSPSGYMRMLTRCGVIERLASDEMIKAFEDGPVPNTRSHARSEAWKRYETEARERDKIFQQRFDWTSFQAKDYDNEEAIKMFEDMLDPYDSQLKPR